MITLRPFACFIAVIVFFVSVSNAQTLTQNSDAFALTGPYTYKNLTIFLIHGKQPADAKKYLTLSEALEQKKVVVHETGNVNELSVENTSDDDVYIQSGDIVKGGQQDRTIGQDVIITAHSGKMPLNAFCVEHGRWQQRGTEQVAFFGSSSDAISGKDLKLAAKSSADQSKVWESVAQNQHKLSANLGSDVAATTSPSSYQLTLENPKVRETTEEYVRALMDKVKENDDIIGYAFAINGKVNSVDMYASRDLFLKQWPKLLKSSAVEAVAELKQDAKFPEVKPADITLPMSVAADAKATDKQLTPRVNLITREAKGGTLFETQDKDAKGQWIHRNYVTHE